jgi:hypothetical protein
MPIIIEGGSRSAGGWWARHLQNTETNERAQLVQVEDLSTDTVRDMFREMCALARGTKCRNYFYQASINPRIDEHLTPAQWRAAVDTLGRNLGLVGQPYFVIEHQKAARTHRHIVWSRINQETMTAISDALTARIHEQTSRQLEAAFGLEAGTSILVPDRKFARPIRRAKKHERFRGAQSGVDPHAVANELKALRESSESGQHFRAALEAAGYVLTRGDRRDFVVVDQAGDDHSLGRQLGLKAAELRAFMKDVEVASLPSVAEAKILQQQYQAERAARRSHAQTAEIPAPEMQKNRVSRLPQDRERRRKRTAPEPIVPAEVVVAACNPERHMEKIEGSAIAALPQNGTVFRLDPDYLRGIVNRLATAAIPTTGITEACATFEFEPYAAMAFRQEVIGIRPRQQAGARETRIPCDHLMQADQDIGGMARKVGRSGGTTDQAFEMPPVACRAAERKEEPRRERQDPERDRPHPYRQQRGTGQQAAEQNGLWWRDQEAVPASGKGARRSGSGAEEIRTGWQQRRLRRSGQQNHASASLIDAPDRPVMAGRYARLVHALAQRGSGVVFGARERSHRRSVESSVPAFVGLLEPNHGR